MIRKPPRYVNLNKGHNLARGLHTCLILNERFGTKVWDHANRKNYNFNATYPPAWNAEGVEFVQSQETIDWIPLDDLPPICTMLFGYRYLTTPSSYWYFFSYNTSYSTFSVHNTGNELQLFIGGSRRILSQNLEAGWADGKDHQFVFQWDSINGYVAIYFDGLLNNEDTPSFSMPSGTNMIGIGARPDGTNRYSGGIYPYFYAYDRLLTAPEIAHLWKNPHAIFGHRINKFSVVVSGATQISVSDTGAGSDAMAIVSEISVSDTGAGSDTDIIVPSLIVSDTGSGNDIVSLLTSLLIADSGAGSDLIGLLIEKAVADIGTGSDIIDVISQIFISVADTGTGIETLSIIVGKLVSDAGIGSDTAVSLASLLVKDSGSGSDVINILLSTLISDYGSGVDAIDVLSGITKAVSDSGAGSDLITIVKDQLVSDTGLGADTVSLILDMIVSDTGTGSDIAGNFQQILLQDIGIGSELVTAINTLLLVYGSKLILESKITDTVRLESEIVDTIRLKSKIIDIIRLKSSLKGD